VDIVVGFADTFTRSYTSAYCKGKVQEDDCNIPKHRSTNRWSFNHRSLSIARETLKKTTTIYQNIEVQIDGRTTFEKESGGSGDRTRKGEVPRLASNQVPSPAVG